MHIIYVDESGDDGFSPSNTYVIGHPPLKHFIRVGVIIHDRKWQKINSEINELKYRYRIPPATELHATEIRNGSKQIYKKTGKRKHVANWFGLNYPDINDRTKILLDCCKLVASFDISIIAVIIDKTKIKTSHIKYKEFPKNNSWEYLIERINLYLTEAQDHNGMIISDAIQHKIEEDHRNFAKALYSQSMHIDSFHFIESILFEPSESSNLLQLADIVAYAFHRKFNADDDTMYDVIQTKIFSKSGNTFGCGLKIWPD
jgi:hypothetical protein